MKNTLTDLHVLVQVDDLCEEFEKAYAQGTEPRIADYLEQIAVEHREKLLYELVALEIGLRSQQGEKAAIDTLLEQYAVLLSTGGRLDTLRSTIEKAVGTTERLADASVDATAAWQSSAQDSDLVRPEIAGYFIQGVLGRGGMGVVYRALQTSLNRLVALKMILDVDEQSAEAIERFEKEAHAVAALNDPHFVQIYEFGRSRGTPFMALEFVEGGSLEQVRQGEPQPERFSAEITEILARAMHKAHSAGLIHRDLKPHNVLMTAEGQPKITDFGLVKRQDQNESQRTQHGRVMGTASYMAPEQSRGEQDIGPAADVHALGGILYCLLTGRPPFLAATIHDTILQVRSEAPVAPSQLRPGISRDVETICLKCLEKEPTKRYASANDLADDLRRYLDGRPIVARPVGRIERAWRWARRNPLGATVALLVLAIAIVSSAMTWRLSVANNLANSKTIEANNRAKEAETARASEKEAHTAKSENYNEVLLAYHTVLDRIDRELRNDQSQVKLRKAINELAMASFRKLRDESEKNPLNDRLEAVGRQRMGDIFQLCGDLKQSLLLYDEAAAIAEKVARQYPSDPAHVRNVAALRSHQANLLVRLGRTTEARVRYRECIELRKKWEEMRRLANHENHLAAKVAVAQGYISLGSVDLTLGDAQQALDDFNAAREWFLKLPEAILKSPTLTDDLAVLEHWLGEANTQLGNLPEGERRLTRAVDKFTALAGREPNAATTRQLCRSQLKLGDFYVIHAQDLPRAWASYKPAYAEYERRWQADPELASARADLANMEYRMGGLLHFANAAQVSLEDIPGGNQPLGHFQRCCELREQLARIDADDMQARIEWAVALARCGRTAEAAEQAETLAAAGPDNPRLLFQAVCTLALCMNSGDEQFASRCCNRTFDLLAKLIDSGWRDHFALSTDPDLIPARGDPRFGPLIERLRAQSRADAVAQSNPP